MPRSCSAARQCHRGGRRRFHRHAAPPGDAPWRCRLVPFSRTVPEYGRVLTRPSTSAAPDQRCAMCPRRPSCPRLTARRATPPTAAFPPRLGQGPRLAHVSLRAMEWPFRRTTTSKHGDWARRRASSGHPYRPPGSVHASGPGDGKPSTSPGPPGAPSPWSPLPAAGCVTWPGPSRPLPRWWCWPGQPLPADAAGGLAVADLGILATSRPSQLLSPPDRRLHGRTVAQALGDANVCYNPSPASDRLRHIRRPRRQAAGLPAVPARS